MKKIKSFLIILISTVNLICSATAQETMPEPVTPVVPWGENIDAQEETRILEKLSPEVKVELLKVKDINAESYNDLLRDAQFVNFEIYPGFMESSEKELYQNERKVDELELQTRAIGIQYQYASQENKQYLKNKILPMLEMLFDLKEKQREMEVNMLEKELTQLKESLIVRKKNKDDIILRRFSELTGTDEYLDW
ncbi:MAG: hypothetical protein P8X73_03635 [Ignavibacteriaceae bacterium]|jgi:hypothetical protein